MNDLTDTDKTAIQKRSVLIAGHRTSVSLEKAFWDELRKIAEDRDLSVNQLVALVDRDRKGNLSSALRLFVLESLTVRPSRS